MTAVWARFQLSCGSDSNALLFRHDALLASALCNSIKRLKEHTITAISNVYLFLLLLSF